MTNPPDNFHEQLSAYMDGELPEAEARFLQRRLEHDIELRAKWMRMQVAATCIKGQPWRPMKDSLSMQVGAEIADEQVHAPSVARSSRPIMRWAMVASIAALAVIFAPRLMKNDATDATTVAASLEAPASEHLLPSPSSADLVALHMDAGASTPAAATISEAPSTAPGDLIASGPDASVKASPLPLSTQPTDFPLVENGDKRSWPRSEIIAGTADDPALEAYLVRHNQMLANDGLGGFVPYVDVVASDRRATAAGKDTAAQDGGADEK